MASLSDSDLADHLSGVPPEALDRPVIDDHLKKLALKLTKWKEVAIFLDLDDGEIEAVEAAVKAEEVRARILKMLRKWRNKFGENATYRYVGSAVSYQMYVLHARAWGEHDTHDISVSSEGGAGGRGRETACVLRQSDGRRWRGITVVLVAMFARVQFWGSVVDLDRFRGILIDPRVVSESI